MCQVAHPSRDIAEEPLSSLMREIRIEAAHAGSIYHTGQARFQRSQTYGVFTEVFNTSARQRELRNEVTYSVTSCLDFRADPKEPTLTKNSCWRSSEE